MDMPAFVPLEELNKIKLYPDISNIIFDIVSGKKISNIFLGNLWKDDIISS